MMRLTTQSADPLPAPDAPKTADDAPAVEDVVRPAAKKLVRMGYAAKGFVYVTMGILAALAAVGTGAGASGARGAMYAIVGRPFGRTLLGAVAAGLAAYVLWQLFRTVADPEHDDPPLSLRSIARRVEYLVSGVIHVGLVAAAVKLILGRGAEDEDELARSWTAHFMAWPAGRWILAGTGAVILIYGLYQVWKGWRSDLDSQLSLRRMNGWARRLVRAFSRFGLAARGMVFLLVGAFLVFAAWQEDPDQARGLGGALRTIQRQPFGAAMLGVVAVGLMSYGLYLFIRAKYRRIDIDLPDAATSE